jgi:hypothetical protein
MMVTDGFLLNGGSGFDWAPGGFYIGGQYDVFYGGLADLHQYEGDFFGQYYNSGASTPPFYSPGLTGSDIEYYGNILLQQGVTLGSQYLSRQIGQSPRGNYTEFLQYAYPMMAAEAKRRGLAVDAFWYGEALRVNPDGHWGVVYRASSLSDYLAWEQALAQRDHFLALVCEPVDLNVRDISPTTCHFREFGSGLSSLFGQGKTLMGSNWIVWGLLGVGVYYAFRSGLLKGLFK